MSLRDHNTATPEAIKRLAEMNLDMSVKIRQLQDRLSEAEKVICDYASEDQEFYVARYQVVEGLRVAIIKDIVQIAKPAREYQAKWKEVL